MDLNTLEWSDSERTRCEIWTRVTGYHRNIGDFNIGKQSEARERMYYSEGKALKSLVA